MSPHNAKEPMDPGDLERKHMVFLCHSGARKGFVEQLDKDLRNVDQYPFFDKDRESLAIGDNFPSLIFEAIECCQVGVVFLSEEFFVQSPWPMFEVVKMVECGRRIMPIFLGISPRDLSNEVKMAEWKSRWEVWAKSNGRIDVASWDSTLRSLRPLNGLVYNDVIGEVKFREEIVKEVCKIVGPFHVWDDSHVQGKSRISKLIQVKISETQMSKKGVQVVGLYGVGGIGKTTACKSLCKDLLLEFDGRVCHIEFGDATSERDRVREVLKRLTNIDNKFLKEGSLEEVKDVLRLHKVVLALDNVWDNFEVHEEAQKFLRLEYGQGSVVMVTGRTLGELEKLGIKIGNCLAMPQLVEEEAKALFLYYVGLENKFDDGDVMECISRCYFGKGDGNRLKHYHPLALRVLGSQMVGKRPLEWKSQLEREDVFNQLQEDESPVFSVLRRSFNSLRNEDKLLFMDVALFDDGGDLRNSSSVDPFLSINWRFIEDQRLTWYTIFEWLSIVHGISVDEVKERLNVLKKRALLEGLGDGTGKIGMHDLWREFAFMELKRGEEDELQWVYKECVSRNQGCTNSCISGGGWKKLRRIVIQESIVESINFSKCWEVTVLRLNKVYVEGGVLDLSHLKSIKSLEIIHPQRGDLELRYEDVYYDLEVSGEKDQQHVSGIGQLLNLAILIWLNIDDESMSAVDEVSCLTNLQVLHLRVDYQSNYKYPVSLDLQQLRYLQDVRVELPGMVSISSFSLEMKGLRILDLVGCRQLRSCVGVGDVDGLEVLQLSGCSKLEELPNLQKLIRLRVLDVHGCELLKAVPGLGSLVALQALYGGRAVEELPSMSNLAKLEVLDLTRCYELKCIPSLGNLVALQELGIYCGWLHGLPDLRNLTLQKVRIYGWNSDDCKPGCGVSGSVLNLAMFEAVPTLEIVGVDHELSNLSKLTALKSLELISCDFERSAHRGSDLILESLTIERCGRMRIWDGVRGLVTGTDSQVDTSSDWTRPCCTRILVMSCRFLEVPDLRHFPQLRNLKLWEWGSWDSMSAKVVVQCRAIHVHLETLEITGSEIKEVPDLGNFPSLRSVEIVDCENLSSLAISDTLSALRRVVLIACRNLRTVPNTNLFPRLSEFAFQQCGVHLNEHEAQKLIARGFRVNKGMSREPRFVAEFSCD